MTVQELADKLSLKIFNIGNPKREITGGYCGDLLSWVMGRAEEGSAWVTIMSNRNVAAVAVMADTACIVLSENVAPDDDMLSKAIEEGLNVFGTEKSTFEIAKDIAKLL